MCKNKKEHKAFIKETESQANSGRIRNITRSIEEIKKEIEKAAEKKSSEK